MSTAAQTVPGLTAGAGGQPSPRDAAAAMPADTHAAHSHGAAAEPVRGAARTAAQTVSPSEAALEAATPHAAPPPATGTASRTWAPPGHSLADASARAGHLLLRLASLALCLLGWHWASTHRIDFGLVTFQNVPPPVEVLNAGLDLVQSPKLGQHLGASLARVFAGFAAAAAAGIALGLLIGRSRWAEDALLPPLEMLRPIPAVAWIPLAILMFPSSEMSMVFITFTGALFPILLNTIHGVEHVDARLVASARSLGSGPFSIFTDVILPGAAPSVVTGLAIGMGTAWFCLVTAEMISGQFGIGYYTWASYTVQNYAEIVVGMLFIGVFGMGSSALIKRLGLALMPWQTEEKKR